MKVDTKVVDLVDWLVAYSVVPKENDEAIWWVAELADERGVWKVSYEVDCSVSQSVGKMVV